MIDLSGSSAHTATEVVEVWLIEADFSGGALYANSSSVPITYGGHTWAPLGQALSLKGLSESADAGTDRLEISLDLVDEALLGFLTGAASVYRRRSLTLSLALCAAGTYAPVLVRPRWVGRMDQLKLEQEAPDPETGGHTTGRIVLTCARAGTTRPRHAEGARLTDVQQRARYPGDTGLRYVLPLIEAPALWLSKRFQEV